MRSVTRAHVTSCIAGGPDGLRHSVRYPMDSGPSCVDEQVVCGDGEEVLQLV